MPDSLFDDLANATARAAIESSIDVGSFFEAIHNALLNQVRHNIITASAKYRAIEIEFDNALAARANQIFNGNDPGEDGRYTIEEDRDRDSEMILGRLQSSLPRIVEFILASLKHAGSEAEVPTNKAEAIGLIVSVISGNRFSDVEDEDVESISSFQRDAIERTLKACSFGFSSDKYEVDSGATIGNKLGETSDTSDDDDNPF